MHVAILVKEFPPDVIGGTETQTVRMARELAVESGHEVTVYTKSYPGPEPHEDVPFDLVRVPTWHYSPFVSTLTFVLAATLYLLRDARNIDVLQCMMIYPSGAVGYLVSRLTGLPYFAWIRGGDYYFAREVAFKRRLLATVFDDALVLVQTESVAEDVREEFPDATVGVLGNGVDIPDRVADGDAATFVGRLKHQKGVHNLVSAVDGLDEEVVIVGDGPEREYLERLADGVDADITFIGEVPPDRVPEYLLSSKLLVLPAVDGEGLPNVLLEAMAHGVPVVSTTVAGIPDVVQDGETGYVVPPDDVDALADRIRRVCEDDAHRAELADNARAFVESEYAWDRLLAELDDVYESVAG